MQWESLHFLLKDPRCLAGGSLTLGVVVRAHPRGSQEMSSGIWQVVASSSLQGSGARRKDGEIYPVRKPPCPLLHASGLLLEPQWPFCVTLSELCLETLSEHALGLIG